MEIAFETDWLRKLCTSDLMARRLWDDALGDALKRRLSDLHAADYVTDIAVGSQPVRGNRAQRKVLLEQGKHLVFEVATPDAIAEDGKVNWQRVYRVKVVSVGGKSDV